MIALRISNDLDRMAKRVAEQQGKVLRAIAQGLNEGGDLVRTQVRAAMMDQTGLRQKKSVTKRESNIRAFATGLAPKSGIGPARGASLSYTIIYHGEPPTKPEEFELNIQKGPDGGVTVWMWNEAHKFKRSFQQLNRKGLRMRLERKGRFPIRGFDGPNLAKEAVKGQVASTFLKQSASLVPPVIEKRLARAL